MTDGGWRAENRLGFIRGFNLVKIREGVGDLPGDRQVKLDNLKNRAAEIHSRARTALLQSDREEKCGRATLLLSPNFFGPVAQLVSASPCHGEGRRFKSDQGRQEFTKGG